MCGLSLPIQPLPHVCCFCFRGVACGLSSRSLTKAFAQTDQYAHMSTCVCVFACVCIWVCECLRMHARDGTSIHSARCSCAHGTLAKAEHCPVPSCSHHAFAAYLHAGALLHVCTLAHADACSRACVGVLASRVDGGAANGWHPSQHSPATGLRGRVPLPVQTPACCKCARMGCTGGHGFEHRLVAVATFVQSIASSACIACVLA